jgi:hypothetical protein
VNTSTRLLKLSVTYIFPLLSIAMPPGRLNWPLPLPVVPHFVMNVPSLLNFCMLLFPELTTYTLPDVSTATPIGPLNMVSSSFGAGVGVGVRVGENWAVIVSVLLIIAVVVAEYALLNTVAPLADTHLSNLYPADG